MSLVTLFKGTFPDLAEKHLDKSLFTRTVQCLHLILPQKMLNNSLIKAIKPYVFKVSRPKELFESSQEEKLFVFDPVQIKAYEDFDSKTIKVLADNELTRKYFQEKSITLHYENWPRAQILRCLLPDELSVSSFSIIGHIAHLNLHEETLPYKQVIGQVILDTCPAIKTVINKLDKIDTQYRFFEYEILAGEPQTIAKFSHMQCTFQLDFAKVYWNPRLNTEHMHIVSQLKACDLLFDVFAGVGPFAVPASRKGVDVYANDLNPESYRWLKENSEKNKPKRGGSLTHFNKDGADFIKEDICRVLKAKHEEHNEEPVKAHVVMNLPAMAPEFLVNFQQILATLPVYLKIFCYCFSKNEPTNESNEKIAKAALDSKNIQQIKSRYIRTVSNNKIMHCIEIDVQNSDSLQISRENKGAAKKEKMDGCK